MPESFMIDCVSRLAGGETLSTEAAHALFRLILEGKVNPTRLSSILTALHVRKETTEELIGAVKAMREASIPLVHNATEAVDVCGTGGDRLNTRNISTAVAFVLSAMGVPVAKHGNRAVSSKSGATDVLAELGIHPDKNLASQKSRLEKYGLVFLAAPLHIPALREIAETRRNLGFRTIFNMIGPACNPARVRRQLIGVSDPGWMLPLAETTGQLGGARIIVACGETDLGFSDEITLSGVSHLACWRDGKVTQCLLDPSDYFGPYRPISDLKGGTPSENAAALVQVLQGEHGVYRDTVCLNAAVALDVAGRGDVVLNGRICQKSLTENLDHIAKIIDEGQALAVMERARDINVSVM